MAVIGKIRQRSGLLIFVIGASIVGFLIMDATNSQGSVLRGRKDYIGKVNGEKIQSAEFDAKYNENEKAQEDQMRGQQLTDDMRDYIRVRTWNEMVEGVIMNNVYDKVGINVTTDEMQELVSGDNVSPQLASAQIFKNPQTGQFDKTMVINYLKNLDKDPEGVEPGTLKREWNNFEKQLKEDQFKNKYSAIISKGLYAPTWLAEMNYNDQSRTVDFQYVALPYNEVNDNDVKVTDEDLKKYLDEHAAEFKQDEETRKIQYVTFNIIPSAKDTARALEDVSKRRDEFASQKGISEDSVFVKLYSQTAFDEVYYTADNLVSPVKDSLFQLPIGSLIGPYLEGDKYQIAKITDRKMVGDSMHLREIKLSMSGASSEDAQKARGKFVDSLYKAIDSGRAEFGIAAALYSDDAVAKMRGGDVGWVKQGEKPKEINDFIFYRAQKGKTYIYGNPQDNAYYIFQVVEDKPTHMGVLATYLSEEITVGEQTQQDISAAASSFASENQTAEKFQASAKAKGMQVKVADPVRKSDYSLFGLGSARKLVKWTYEAKKGEVSTPITLGDKHVVAYLDVVRAKGTPELDAVKDRIQPEVLKEKKYELLAKRLSDAGTGGMDAIAGKVGKPVQVASQASFGNPALNGSYEPSVVAAALATGTGKFSKPIKGNSGAYVVQVTNITEPAKATDFTAIVMQMKQRLAGKAQGAAEAQRKLANVEDDRLEFYQ